MLEPASQPIFLKYKNALLAIGVDFSDESVREVIEDCSHNLESRFQAIISYWCWLQKQQQEIVDANKLLLQAFHQEWNPINWKEEFLNRDEFKSPAEKWWSKARNIDVIKNLVVDVSCNFWSGGRVTFGTPEGQVWTVDLSRVMDMSWSEIIEYYQRVTGIKIEQYPGRLILHKPPSNTSRLRM